MLDRLRALLAEKAAANAAHDGVPIGLAHLHGAAYEIAALLLQARDRLIAEHHRPVQPAAPEPSAAPSAEVPTAAAQVEADDPAPQKGKRPTANAKAGGDA